MRARTTLASVAALLAVTTCAALGLAGAAPPSQRLAVHEPVRTVSPAKPTPRQAKAAEVTLVTGERVSVSTGPDGAQSAALTPVSESSASAVRFTYGGDQYVVPSEAVPFVGGLLDPRLFDVSYLVRAHRDDAHTAAPSFVTTGLLGKQAPALPGTTTLSIQNSSRVVAQSRAAAAQFGSALRTGWRSIHSGHGAPLALANLAHVSLPSIAGAPMPVTPASATPRRAGIHYYTVTLDFLDQDGLHGAAIGWLQNVDDASLGLNFFAGTDASGIPSPTSGPISFSVPAGHYSAQFSIVTPHATDNQVDTTLAVKSQFTVAHDTSLTLDARAGTQFRANVATRLPRTLEIDELDVGRTSAQSGGLTTQLSVLGPLMGLVSYNQPPPAGTGTYEVIPTARLFATPTSTTTIGNLELSATVTMWTNPVALGRPNTAPLYFLSFPSNGSIPRSLTYSVGTSQLTTVRSTVYATPVPATGCTDPTVQLSPVLSEAWGGYSRLGEGALELAAIGYGPRTDYWYTSEPAHELWSAEFSDHCLNEFTAQHTLRAGAVISQTFGESPPTPAPTAPLQIDPVSGLPEFPATRDGSAGIQQLQRRICAACREKNVGMLYLQARYGNDTGTYAPTQFLATDLRTTAFTFLRNGVQVLGRQPGLGTGPSPQTQSLPLVPGDASYRLHWAFQSRADLRTSVTDWTFRSAESDALVNLPPTESCAPDPARACSLLPLLFVGIRGRINTQSQVTAGASVPFTITVEHQDGSAKPAGVTVSVQFSYDDGKAWSTPGSAVSLGANVYRVTTRIPDLADTSGYVSMRVVARDAAGNSVTQTNVRAYGVTR